MSTEEISDLMRTIEDLKEEVDDLRKSGMVADRRLGLLYDWIMFSILSEDDSIKWRKFRQDWDFLED